MSEPDLTEAQVQRRLVGKKGLFRQLGIHFWRIGQRNARGTQDPGVPDIVAFSPRHGMFWVECKRSVGGRQSPEQKEFQLEVEAAGGTYLLTNDVSVVARFLGAK